MNLLPLVQASLVQTSKRSICVLLASALVTVPAYAQSQALPQARTQVQAGGMISTGVLVSDLDRTQAQERVEQFVGRADVQKMLMDRGVSANEVRARLASLSEQELRQLAGQVDQAKAGGEVVGLLVVVLLVVLIVFLVKKM